MNQYYFSKYRKYKKKYLQMKSIKQSVNELNASTNSFIFGNIGLTNEEIKVINLIKIKRWECSYFGKFNNSKLFETITDFIKYIGNDKLTSDKITNILINKVVEPFLKAMNNNSLWLTIRTFQPEGNHIFIDGILMVSIINRASILKKIYTKLNWLVYYMDHQ